MATLNLYLNFNGNTEAVFNFYKSVFGGEFASLQRFRDIPGGGKTAEADLDKIMHISLPVGNGSVLMGSDVVESMQDRARAGSNFYISIDADSKAEADRLFSGLSSGGVVEMPIQDAFWGSYFGMLEDRFGIHWMVSFAHPQP